MLKYPLAILPLAILFGSRQVSAQIPGTIFYPTTQSSQFLNPDANASITSSSEALVHGHSELSQFEGNWEHWFQIHTEPSADNESGASCSAFDIVDAPTDKGALYIGTYDPDGYPSNNDGDEYFLARLRLGADPGNDEFGFSLLIDSDNLFGDGTDPNATGYNPGYEIEIRFKNGIENGGVFLDDIDGQGQGTNLESYSYNEYHQKSYALKGLQNCESHPVFIDIGIPYSDLQKHFNLSSGALFRLVAATTAQGESALTSGFVDLAGVDKTRLEYKNDFNAITELLNLQPLNRALPVSLSHLAISTTKAGKQLVWETASEVNTEHFEVEMSYDGTHYIRLASIPAKGSSTVGASYSFNDFPEMPEGTKHFLRLKMMDFDHSFSYSKTIEVSAQKKHIEEPKIFPNPATTHFVLQHKNITKGFYKIYDQSAMVVLDGKLLSDAPIDISSLQPGVYHVCFHTEGKAELQRLLVK